MSDDVMTVKEVMEYLNISRATLYRRIESGLITPIKGNDALIKQPLLFRRSDVEALKFPNLQAA